MREILLGIDIGTSSCKAAAFTRDGTVAAQSTRDYPVHYPQDGWAEQEPDVWWQAVCRAVSDVLGQGIDPKEIRGVGIDGQSWSAIPVDEAGNVLSRTPIWMDTRASGICDAIKRDIGEDRIFAVSGNPVQPMYTMPKVIWYRENLPEIYRRTYKILQSNSFIAFRLTGVMSQDVSQGYGWGCYNMSTGEWDLDLCRELGIETGLLPDIVPCHQVIGKVTGRAALETGLAEGTPVVAGGLDAACGTLGVGVIEPGQTQEQGGQAGGMSICTDKCAADKRLILSAHVVPGMWLLQGGTVGGSGCLKWFEQEFGAAERAMAADSGRSSFAEIDDEASSVEPGCGGMVFLPYMAGERSPIWDASAKGVFYGVGFSKTRAHFARAVMEGVAYSLRHNLEVAAETGAEVSTMYSMGGAANSRLWTQLKADVTGRKILVPSADTATALGAAILAGVGVGMYGDFREAVDATVQIRREHIPNAELSEVYNRNYGTYRALYNNLKNMMKEA